MSEDDDLIQRTAYACGLVNAETLRRIHDVMVSGCLPHELAFDYEPPTVTLANGLLIVSENFRFI